ncbi:MAG TPA: hypothetical protein VF618_05740 [Thermoanaerobaculia bacterium]
MARYFMLLVLTLVAAVELSAQTAVYSRTFYRDTGKPVQEADTFVTPGGRNYIVRVINGDMNGNNRATSGVIMLNGRVIATPADFKHKVPEFTTEAAAEEVNEIIVEVRGKPGSAVTVLVERPPE